MKKSLHTLIVCFACLCMHAQDLHWSQPGAALLYLNPGFTGIEGPYSAGLNFKDQWSVAGRAYRTYMAAGDVRLNNYGGALVSIGGLLSSDVAGNGGYKTVSMGMTSSCLIKAGKSMRVGLGIGANYMQNSLSDDGYQWGNQFDGELFNSSMSSYESQGKLSHHYFDLNAGVSFVYDEEKGSLATSTVQKRWVAGYSMNHLTTPVIAMTGSGDKLALKHTAFVKGQIPLGEKYSIVPEAVAYVMGVHMEITGGVLLKRQIGLESKITGHRKSGSAAVGLLFRTNSGFIPTIEVQKSNYIVGISYDINTFGFAKASLRGGLELTLRLRAGKTGPQQPKKHGRPKKHGKWF